MKKKKMRLKGKLRLYMNWPLIMTFLLVAMNIWVLMVDRKAAFIMFMFILIYLAIAGGLYFYNRSLILADLIQFSTQYKGIENTLLKELAVPYAIALEDGRILWKNDAFSKLTQSSRKEKYLYRMIPALTTSVFPKDDMEHVEMEVEYCDRHYQAELRRVSLHGFSDKEKLLQIPEEEEFFVAVSMQDVTELNAYIRENEEQRMIAGLIYIDNYDEVMESVEEVRQSLLVALIDRKINKYIGDVDGIVKKMEKDKYFIVLRKSAYKKIAEDRFSLLEEVKYESKIVYRTEKFEDKVRTFCMNPYGIVVNENTNGIVTVNGHSYEDPKKQTENTNFALLVAKHFSEPFKDSNGYGESIARLSNMLGGGVIVQRFGDLTRGRRSTAKRIEEGFVRPTLSAEPGDLSLVLPKRILDGIIEMIYALDKIAPGTANDDTLLYGVEVKFYNMEVKLDEHLETNHKGLYVIGDGSGVTHSLSHASASGVYVARSIAKRK